MLLQDKVIIVTGGGGGLGAGIARVCAREGARVVVADVRDDAAAEVAAELGGAKAIACDIRDDAALDELVATTVDSFGRIRFSGGPVLPSTRVVVRGDYGASLRA